MFIGCTIKSVPNPSFSHNIVIYMALVICLYLRVNRLIYLSMSRSHLFINKSVILIFVRLFCLRQFTKCINVLFYPKLWVNFTFSTEWFCYLLDDKKHLRQNQMRTKTKLGINYLNVIKKLLWLKLSHSSWSFGFPFPKLHFMHSLSFLSLHYKLFIRCFYQHKVAMSVQEKTIHTQMSCFCTKWAWFINVWFLFTELYCDSVLQKIMIVVFLTLGPFILALPACWTVILECFPTATIPVSRLLFSPSRIQESHLEASTLWGKSSTLLKFLIP